MASFEAAVQSDFTSAQTRVYNHGGITGAISDGATVTGQTNSYTATVRVCTATQILVFHDTPAETFEAGEVVQVDGSNYIAVAADDGGGDTVIIVPETATTGAIDGAVTFAGSTLDSTNKRIIRATSGHEAVNSGWDSSRYRLSTGSGWTPAVILNDGDTDFIGVQLEHTGTAGNGNRCIEVGSSFSGGILLQNCRGRWAGTGTLDVNDWAIQVSSSATPLTLTIENSCFQDYYHGLKVLDRYSGSATVKIYNSLFQGFVDNAIVSTGSGANLSFTIKNTASFNNGDDFDITGVTPTIDRCASDDGDGTNNVQPAAWANALIDFANGDYRRHGTDSDLDDAGVGPSSDTDVPSTDMAGGARSGATCDIGLHEWALRTLTPTIDPDGSGDYSSNQAAYDANYGGENADFVKYGYRVRANFICTGGTADGNLVTTGALTTSATYDVQIDVGSAYRHDGSYPASGGNIARIEQTTDACVVIQDEYFTLKNMAAKLTATTGYPSAFYTNKQGTHFENCVAWTQGTSIETYCFYVVGAGSAESNWENCIGVGDASAYNYGFYEHPTPAGAQRVHNCTFVSQDAAVASRAGSKVIYVNCILWGDVLTANAALNASSEYNAHKSAAVGGATNWVDWSARSKAEVFEDTANGHQSVLRRQSPGDRRHRRHGPPLFRGFLSRGVRPRHGTVRGQVAGADRGPGAEKEPVQ
jgi:hypothetical protein